MKKPTFRRIIAYLVDTIIISAIVTIFTSIDLINPQKEEYNNKYKEYQNYYMSIMSSDNTADIAEILNNETMNDINYDLSYYGVYYSVITLVVTFLYFCIFQYYNDGKTIGKALLNIKIVSTNSKKLKIEQVIIRSSIINSLLTSSAVIILLLYSSKSQFINANLIIGYIDMALIFTSIGMILIREDGAGLHDKLAHTLVVDSRYAIEEDKEKNVKVKEADYEEVKTKKEKKESEK